MSGDGEVKAVEVKKDDAKKDSKDCKWTSKDGMPGCSWRRGLSEEEIGKKMDVAFANTAVKTAVGFGIGALTSFVLFKRRPWPIIAGTAFGFGLGVGNAKSMMECGRGGKRPAFGGASCPMKKSTDADQKVPAGDIAVEIKKE